MLVMLWGCQKELPDSVGRDGSDNKTVIETIDESVAVPGQIIIKLNVEPADEDAVVVTRSSGVEVATGLVSLDRIAADLGAVSMTRVFPHAGRFEERTRKAGLHLWYLVEFDENIAVTRAANEFASSEYVAAIEPVMYVRRLSEKKVVTVDDVTANLNRIGKTATSGFNDPLLSEQWHYENDGSRSYWTAGADIRLFEAWEQTTGHPDVIVSVVDGGVCYTHPDLAANMWINEAEMNGTAGVDDDGNGYTDDIYGYNFVYNQGEIQADLHGTHVAGTIAAVNNNGIGVAGIAGGDGTPGSGVRIMSCQIFYDDIRGNEYQATVANTLAAIKYGADNGAVISQNSWGYPSGYTPTYLSMYVEAVEYFIEYAGKDEYGNQTGPMNGGIVIFSSGNSASSALSYPGAIESVVSVSAFAPNYRIAYYSNYGTWVSISAPGGDSNYGEMCEVLSTIGGYNRGIYTEGYAYMQGTSMACPHVSGIAALYISKYGVGTPGLTPEKLKARMFETADPVIYDYNPAYTGMLGAGLIDAAAILRDEATDPEPPVLARSLPQVTLKGADAVRSLDLDNYFSDPQGGNLEYTVSVYEEGVVTCSISGSNLTLTLMDTGWTEVEVTATNDAGLSLTSFLKVICIYGNDGGVGVENPGEREQGEEELPSELLPPGAIV